MSSIEDLPIKQIVVRNFIMESIYVNLIYHSVGYEHCSTEEASGRLLKDRSH